MAHNLIGELLATGPSRSGLFADFVLLNREMIVFSARPA
jgi:hypothetical protein